MIPDYSQNKDGIIGCGTNAANSTAYVFSSNQGGELFEISIKGTQFGSDKTKVKNVCAGL